MRSTQSCAGSPVLAAGDGAHPGIGPGSGPPSHWDGSGSPVDDSLALSSVVELLVVVALVVVDAVVSAEPLAFVVLLGASVVSPSESESESAVSPLVPIDSLSASFSPEKHAETAPNDEARTKYLIPAVEHDEHILYNAWAVTPIGPPSDRTSGARGARRQNVSPQVVAVKALRTIDKTRGFSNRVIGDLLERDDTLAPGARALVTALVYGVLRHRSRLDAHIDARARAPKSLGAVPRELLRVGAYEILELGRAPGNAIGHAVDAARSFDPSRALSGLVHGVLAAVAKGGAELDAKHAAAAPLDALDKRWSIPRWISGRWLARLGPERALLRAQRLAEVPSVDLRVDLSRIDLDTAASRLAEERPDAVIERVPDMPQALRVRGGGDLFFGALHDDGFISVQGLAAQQPVIVLAPQPGQRVLDACAGIGIKTLQLAELMQRRGQIVAADREAGKLTEQSRMVARGRLDAESLDLRLVAADLTAPSPELDALSPFDAVLLDVPCTGLGNLARHPEIRWHREYADIATAAAIQGELLARIAPHVRPGGRLVYAACSPETEEGPAIIRALLDSGAAFDLQSERTWTPEEDSTEGFYVAALVRS